MSSFRVGRKKVKELTLLYKALRLRCIALVSAYVEPKLKSVNYVVAICLMQKNIIVICQP